MRILLFILTLLPTFIYGQIKVDKAGDGWDLQIDSAIELIKKTDTSYYNTLIEHCNHIEIWNESFSSNEPRKNGKGTILVAVGDIKLNSINNLAAVLVHESAHLRFRKIDGVLEEEDEERLCYLYEYAFVKKIPNLEKWIEDHILQMLN
jgi:hypothetical protein